MLATT